MKRLFRCLDPRNFSTTQVLESGCLESGHSYDVLRRKYWLRNHKTEICIQAPHGVYSAIWEDCITRVPYYPEVQDHILSTVQSRNLLLLHALVLGGAGCAIPRFLLGNFDSLQVVTVEYSKILCGLAEKYFLSGVDTSRMCLICEDAFTYIAETNLLFDIIFVDLFNQDTLVAGVFEQQFYDDLYNILSASGIVYINVYGIAPDELEHLHSHVWARYSVDHLMLPHVEFIILTKK